MQADARFVSRLQQRHIIDDAIHEAPLVRGRRIQWLAEKQQRAGALMTEQAGEQQRACCLGHRAELVNGVTKRAERAATMRSQCISIVCRHRSPLPFTAAISGFASTQSSAGTRRRVSLSRSHALGNRLCRCQR